MRMLKKRFIIFIVAAVVVAAAAYLTVQSRLPVAVRLDIQKTETMKVCSRTREKMLSI